MSLSFLCLTLAVLLQSISPLGGWSFQNLHRFRETVKKFRHTNSPAFQKDFPPENSLNRMMTTTDSGGVGSEKAAFLPSQKINPKLSGNFKPVLDERTDDNLEVIGNLPAALNGLFVRNGPNPIHPSPKHHWLDGDGMLHGIYFKDGKVRYLNRFVQTRGFLLEKFFDVSLYGGIEAGLPFPFKNPANTAVVEHHGKLFALWEAGLPYSINSSDLSTIRMETFGGQLSKSFTAHPKIDPLTGELLAFWYGWSFLGPEVHYVALSPDGILKGPPISIPLKNSVIMHDFAITKNYTIFMELPLVFDIYKFKLKYKPELGARIGILPRTGTANDIKWFDVEPSYVFHTVNAYENDDEILLYALAHRSAETVGDPSLYRWKFNLKSGTVDEGYVDERKIEFPVVNRNVVGQPFRYFYATLSGQDAWSGLIKYDLEKKESSSLFFGDGQLGGEAIFVPDASRGNAEDSGWIMNIIYDATKDSSEVVIYDAADFGQPPVARILLPRRVPFGLHGTWVGR